MLLLKLPSLWRENNLLFYGFFHTVRMVTLCLPDFGYFYMGKGFIPAYAPQVYGIAGKKIHRTDSPGE